MHVDPQHVHHELFEKPGGLRPFGVRRTFIIELEYQVAELEHSAQSLSRVQVRVHRSDKILFDLDQLLVAYPVLSARRVLSHYTESVGYPLEAALGVLQVLVRKIDRAPVVCEKEIEPYQHRIVFGEDVPEGEEIAERLAHLLLIDVNESVVYPVFCERLPGGAFRLRDLVLVMREYQIKPSAVYVKSIAKVFGRHRGTLDVPAGPALSPRRIPAGFALFCGFPKREIKRSFFALINGNTRSFLHVVELPPGELAVVFELGDLKINVAVDHICKTAFNELFDNAYHVSNVFGGFRIVHRSFYVKPVHHLEIAVYVLLCQLGYWHLRVVRLLNDLIVYIGDVLDVIDRIAGVREVPVKDVERDVRPAVAQMGLVVRRDAAYVHVDLLPVQRHKDLIFPRQRVVKF